MIKNKNNIIELLESVRKFTYVKDTMEIDVSLKENSGISIRQNTPTCFVINFMDLDTGISTLYKDRKYINKDMY